MCKAIQRGLCPTDTVRRETTILLLLAWD